MSSEFYRLKRLPPYLFAEVNGMKAKARTAGEDIIDLGMGNPDSATPRHIVDKLIEAVQNPKTHGYSSSRGIAGLRRAHAAYYARRFGVEIDPETETIVTLGSKEGFANLAVAMSGPGDVVICPNPTYPIHAFGFIIAGAVPRYVPIGEGRNFVHDLERAVKHSIPSPIAVVINFPSNPTAMTADLAFYDDVIGYCKKRGIYVI
ncbi:MAG TPA: aminotransferase class I/II-fold pyridoxal phosphate-dependent enzyme, partial [Alphaproteobacteria bacterium]